jgi:tetratricopeptide (TPR) repeat protein
VVPGLAGERAAGIAHNALGVLLRRAGRLDEAKSCLRYAAALLVASSDLHALQAALFNLGHAVHAGARSPEDRREALKLIALDREIDAELNIGRDSAQAEIVAGMICLELGEWERASEWLRKGQEIEVKVDSPYDRGGLAELEARLLWCRAWREKGRLEPGAVREVLRLYRQAEELLLAAGDVPAYLKEEVRAVKRGEAPPWLAGRAS